MSKERELLQYILNSHAANGSKLDKFWKAKIEELLAQPEQKPLSDFILTKEIDIIKKDVDFSNVRPWQIYYVMRKTEELYGIGIGVEDE